VHAITDASTLLLHVLAIDPELMMIDSSVTGRAVSLHTTASTLRASAQLEAATHDADLCARDTHKEQHLPNPAATILTSDVSPRGPPAQLEVAQHNADLCPSEN
jgi:hypothetical protein